MLFFVDETWQEVEGARVGALGAIGIEQSRYNAFAADVFAKKRTLLGAQELMDHAIGGNRCLSKNQFKRRDEGREAKWLVAADKFFELLARHKARVFVIWTTDPELLTLRNPATTALTKPYKQLLFDFRALMERKAKGRLGSLNFDQRGTREDAATACAISNYFYRTRGGWKDHFVLVPNFTVSAVSPGLQAADLVAYLGAFAGSPKARPELGPFIARMKGLRYEFDRPDRTVRTVRRVG
jgi:Protein of unknown function (DUF3800)